MPVPDFQHTGPACLSDSVFFTNFSTPPNGYITQWEWDFGDGNLVTVNFPNDPNVSHQYTNDGTFQVTLTVTDSDSCTESTYRQVIIVPDRLIQLAFPPHMIAVRSPQMDANARGQKPSGGEPS